MRTMLLLDLALRPVRTMGPQALPRAAAELGCEGIAVGPGGASRGELEALLPEALVAGAPVRVLAAPLAEAPLPPHKRLPSLCSQDEDERDAAVKLVESSLELARTFDVRWVTLSLGPVPLSLKASAFERAFGRRAWREDEADRLGSFAQAAETALAGEAFAERQARSAMLLDAARFSLERLTEGADRHGVVLALEVAATPWEFPGPREALAFQEEYRGAPLGLVWDVGRLCVLATLGLGQSASRLADLASAARIVRLNDAVGLEVGFLPGLGVPAPPILAAATPPVSVPWVVAGRRDTTDAELAEGTLACRRELARRTEEDEKARARTTGSNGASGSSA